MIPQIENSVAPDITSPYLVGKSVADFSCKDRYTLKDPQHTSAECQAFINEHGNIQTKWSDIAEILCIPGNLKIHIFCRYDAILTSINLMGHSLAIIRLNNACRP